MIQIAANSVSPRRFLESDHRFPLHNPRILGLGDAAGTAVGLEAYHLSLAGKPAPVIDGVTGDQRFFYGWAQVWQSKYREEALKQQIATDPHSPAEFRVIGPVRNVDAWYEAFGVKPGDKYYLAPEDRVRIW